MTRQLRGNCEVGSGSVALSMSECDGGVGMDPMGVGRERLNVERMMETMVGVRVGSVMVMKASFSSMTLVEGNAQKWMVGEMEFVMRVEGGFVRRCGKIWVCRENAKAVV